MIAYVDTSVLLRIVLVQADPLPEWTQITSGVCSALVRVEAQRTLDRLYLRRLITTDEFDRKRAQVAEAFENVLVLPIDDATITAAAQPATHTLRTLDALHLTTAIRYRAVAPIDAFATHDHALATAARAAGFAVLGA